MVVAFSGGLDTSFLVARLKHEEGARVITVTVDTGGLSGDERQALAARAQALGAARHVDIDAREDVFRDHVAWLIQANVLRGSVYPLSVAAERLVQARHVVAVAREENASVIVHGSTGAGNDQVRFDVAFRALAPDLEIRAPVRDEALTRDQEVALLESLGHEVPARTGTYSINAGLWGTTIGGGEISDPWSAPAEEAYVLTRRPEKAPVPEAEDMEIGFEQGVPVSLAGERLEPLALIERLNDFGARHGYGRGIHLGDTILGLKGRIAFEAPAPLILIAAHRELEKLVLTRWQLLIKEQVSQLYGTLCHEGLMLDPACADVEALLASSQKTVTGEARACLRGPCLEITGVRSQHSLSDSSAGVYGEEMSLWDGRDARGFSRIYGLQGVIARSVRGS